MDDLTTSNFAEELLSSNNFSRRVFVRGLGFVSIGLLFGVLGGCEQLADAIKNRPVRRRLRTGSPEVDADIATYRQAVTLMKTLDTTNPADHSSWLNQATIHGIPAHFNFCQHGTDHFFDWHRAYLVYFERICQKLTGNPKFGLPYWNWNQDPDIHPAFLDSNSSLFMARTRTSMSGSSSITTAELDPIFADTNFFTFSSQLEGTPHNNVHTYTGGTFGGYASARDPIFWMHHCMVDYSWYKWNVELGNDNTNDSGWIGTVNSHFFDPDGNAATFPAGLTTLLPLISYQYESSAIGSSPAAAAIKTKAEYQKVEKRIKEGANIRFDVKQRVRLAERAAISIARPISKETKLSSSDFSAIINADTAKDRVFVSIDFAQLPPTSDFYVRVFVNLPNASTSTRTDDPHYAGSFSFFGTTQPGAEAGPEHQHQPHFLVNITETLQRLKRNQELRDGSPISVQLVPFPFAGKFEKDDTQLVLEGIDIITTPVIIKSPPQ